MKLVKYFSSQKKTPEYQFVLGLSKADGNLLTFIPTKGNLDIVSVVVDTSTNSPNSDIVRWQTGSSSGWVQAQIQVDKDTGFVCWEGEYRDPETASKTLIRLTVGKKREMLVGLFRRDHEETYVRKR